MTCERHPAAGEFGLHCPACLLEEALAASVPIADGLAGARDGSGDIDFGQLVVQLPLGRSESASVFLVTQTTTPGQLLRLKVWRSPAAPGFPDRFERLKTQLAGWHDPAVDMPIAACVDAAGRATVVSRFRRGMPLLEVLRSGTLDPQGALAQVASLAHVLSSAHERGLAHGSIVPGNVMVHAGSAHLLDFGLAALLRPSTALTDLMASDRDGLTALQRAIAP